MAPLTVWHELHSRNHRPAEMDRAQGIVTLTPGKAQGNAVIGKSCWYNNIGSVCTRIYLCGIIIMHESGVISQDKLSHLPVFSLVSL